MATFPTQLVPTSRVIDLLPVSHAPERIAEFHRSMIRGDSFPPISGIRIGSRIVVADGHKRLSAYRLLERESLHVEVWPLRRWLADQGRQARKAFRRLLKAFREMKVGKSEEARNLFGGTGRHYKRILASLVFLVSRRFKSVWTGCRQLSRDFLEMVACQLLLVTSKLLCRLPRPFVARLGGFLGSLAFYLLSGHRKTSLQNLRTVFGDDLGSVSRRRIARASFTNMTRTSALLLRSSQLAHEELSRFLEYDRKQLDRIQRACRPNQGIILVSLHFGDWEMGAQCVGSLGLPVLIEPCAGEGEVVLFKSSEFGKHIWKLRGITGNRKADSVGEMIEAVTRGQAVACLADLNGSFRRPGAWIDFMGKPSYTKITAGEIAVATRAPIFFCWCQPLEGGRVRFSCVPVDYSEASTAAEISQQCLSSAAEVIQQNPEFWLWCYRKWRRRPTPQLGAFPAYSKYRKLGLY